MRVTGDIIERRHNLFRLKRLYRNNFILSIDSNSVFRLVLGQSLDLTTGPEHSLYLFQSEAASAKNVTAVIFSVFIQPHCTGRDGNHGSMKNNAGQVISKSRIRHLKHYSLRFRLALLRRHTFQLVSGHKSSDYVRTEISNLAIQSSRNSLAKIGAFCIHGFQVPFIPRIPRVGNLNYSG